MSNNELVPIDFDEVIRETDDSKLFRIDTREVWIPKSQIKDEGDTVIMIPAWLAVDRELA